MNDRYVLVSPCKDEAEFIETTIRSVRAQSIQPVQWIMVDDGSTDATADIIAAFQDDIPYIKLVTRRSAARAVGGGVIRAFEDGFAQIDVPYDFVCKLDVDLDLPPNYFEELLRRMDADPILGTCSGKPYYINSRNGKLTSELCGDEASVGMTKFYRKECFSDIGGFARDVGWDGFDCHAARWHGWRARSWDDAELRFVHLRPMGSSQKSIYRGRIRHGRGQYLLGAQFVFFMASMLARSLRQRPYVLGAAFAVYGYLKALYQREKRFGTRELTKFIQAYQLRAMLLGKARSSEISLAKRRREIADTKG